MTCNPDNRHRPSIRLCIFNYAPAGGYFMTICALTLMLLLFSAPARGGDAYPHLWSGFSTSLAGRSAEQRHNAAQAGEALNGMVIQPGQTFRFNGVVGARDSSKGYSKAPMIDTDGSLRDVHGGGVCQLATTLYNAALLAGMAIVERHPHSRAVKYVPPGRDATIISWRKDLKFRNPHDVPLLLRVRTEDERLTVSFHAPAEKPFSVEIRGESIPLEPEAMVLTGKGRAGGAGQRGGRGFTAVTRRITTRNGVASEELLSEDIYPPPSRLIAGEAP